MATTCDPHFSEVIKSAYQMEHLDWDSLTQLKKKMGKAAWLPTLSVGYDRVIKATDSIDFNDNISVTSGGVFIGPEDSNITQSVNQGDALKFRALWRLDQLVFPDATIQAQNLERSIFKDRQYLNNEIYKLFLEREKLKSEANTSTQSIKKRVLLNKLKLVEERIQFYSGKFNRLCGGSR